MEERTGEFPSSPSDELGRELSTVARIKEDGTVAKGRDTLRSRKIRVFVYTGRVGARGKIGGRSERVNREREESCMVEAESVA